MKTVLRLWIVLAVCRAAVAQQSYVMTEPSSGANPFWSTNIANVLISNVTFHGKVTFINNSNSPSLWNTNGAGLYTASDSHAHSIRFGSNNVMGSGVLYATIFGTRNTNGAGTWSSTISGGSNNWIFSNAVGSVISGGVDNRVSEGAFFSFVGGGNAHLMNGTNAVLVGGYNNDVNKQYGALLGGAGNQAREYASVLGGGLNNVTDSGDFTIVVGGEANVARGDWSFIGGGDNNNMLANTAGSDGVNSVIVGGSRNTIGVAATFGATYGVIVGGRSNTVQNGANYAIIVGGSKNDSGANTIGSFIGGGFNNSFANNTEYSVIGGGRLNTSSGDFSAILGGVSNNVSADYAFALGNFVTNATTQGVEIGQGTVKSRFDANGLTVSSLARATNGFASYSSNMLASTSITVGASPFLWTNSLTKNVVVYIDGVSVTGTVGRNGSTVFGTIGQNTVILQPGEWATVTYTLGSPTATFHPF